MKRLLICLALLVIAAAPVLAQKTKSNMTTEFNNNLPNNTTGQITPQVLRNTLTDLLNSLQQYAGVNPQTGTSYTVQASDYGQLVSISNANAVAVTLPQPTGSFQYFNTYLVNNGKGVVTISPINSTINDAAAFSLAANQGIWVVSDTTNYQVFKPTAIGGMDGKAHMYPRSNQTHSGSDPYVAVDPFGNPINCTGTQTQCLQEFITATASNGWPAEVSCQGTQFPSGLEPVYIQADTSVSVPVAQDWSFHSYGCNLNFSVTTVSGLIIDSMGASIFDWDGKIVYNVTAPNGNTTVNPSCAILINPHTNTQDGFPGLYAGLFRVKSPVSNPQGGTQNTGLVCINTGSGSTVQQRLDFSELNGNNATFYGVLIYGASANTGFMQNSIDIEQIHGTFFHAVDVGTSTSNQVNYNANLWQIQNIESTNSASRCIDSWASYDVYDLGTCNNGQGGLGIGLISETGSQFNKFRYGNVSGFSINDWRDNGTCNEFSGTGVISSVNSSGSKKISSGVTGCAAIFGTLDGHLLMMAGINGIITTPNGVTMANNVAPNVQIFGTGATGSASIMRQSVASATTNGGTLILGASPSTPTFGNFSAIISGTKVGSIFWGGDNGTNATGLGSTIAGASEGNWSTTSTPGRLTFSTAATNNITVTDVLAIDSRQHLNYVSGLRPGISGCGGGSPVIAAASTDNAGQFTVGTAATNCTITFSTPYVAPPFCVVSWLTNLPFMAFTTTASIISVSQTSTTGNKLSYVCYGQ